MKVVVAKRVADSGHVHGGEEKRSSCGVSLVELKDAIDLDSEDGMRDHIHDVNHEKAINKICDRKIVVEPVYYADFLRCEYRYLCSVKYYTHNCAQNEQKGIPHSLVSVIVS